MEVDEEGINLWMEGTGRHGNRLAGYRLERRSESKSKIRFEFATNKNQKYEECNVGLSRVDFCISEMGF